MSLRLLNPRGALWAVLVASAAACGGQEESLAPVPTGWRVSAGVLRAPDGRTAILRGVNLAGAHKQAPYFGFHTAADFARVHDEWGMNAIRLLTTWAAIEPEVGSFDEAYLDALGQRLDWARAAGLAVVLDMHQDVYGEGFGFDGAPRWTCDEQHYADFVPISPWFLNYQSPEVLACVDGFWAGGTAQEHYVEAWRRLAARFATHQAVVGFEPMNEPHWGSHPIGSFEAEVLAPFYERVVAAVHELAPGWMPFLEPSASRNLGVPTGLPTMSFGAFVYAPHAYDASAEQGNGFDEAHQAAFETRFGFLRDEASALGAALWIGEYGGTSSSPGITPYMDGAYDGAASVLAGTAYWAYDRDDGGYGLVAGDGSDKDELLDAVVRPYPQRIAGDPQAIAFDEATSTFVLDYTPDPALTAPTEIGVPLRAYPGGYQVSCQGCSYTEDGATLHVTVPPSDGRITLTP